MSFISSIYNEYNVQRFNYIYMIKVENFFNLVKNMDQIGHFELTLLENLGLFSI